MPEKPDYPELADAQADWRWAPPADCLRERVVLVTGASAGIGAAAARTFASYGADVILLARNQDRLERVYDWITDNTATRPTIVPCDLALVADANAEALAELIDRDYGRLNGVLHNASALGPKVPIEHYPTEDWEAVFRVNVHGTFVLTRALLPLLRHTPDSAMVFTSSSVGRAGRAYWGAYSVSKFATEGLMQVLADELEAASVAVNSVNPGGTRTAMRSQAYPNEDPQTVPAPERHMDLYLWLMSRAAGSQTGHAYDARDWSPTTRAGSG